MEQESFSLWAQPMKAKVKNVASFLIGLAYT